MQFTTKCPRCGLKQNMPVPFCPACGYAYQKESATSPTRIPESRNRPTALPARYGPTPFEPLAPRPTTSAAAPPVESLDFGKLFGWRVLKGTIIAVEAAYMAKRESSKVWLIVKLLLAVVLSPVIIAAVIAGFVIGGMWSMFFSFGRNGRPGFFSHLASQVLGYFLTGKLFGPKDQEAVRDVRLRSCDGQEHLVRIRGDFTAGNVAVGDEVEIAGFDRRGTLLFHRGYNQRTRSEIQVRR